jgi:hypothetical protein
VAYTRNQSVGELAAAGASIVASLGVGFLDSCSVFRALQSNATAPTARVYLLDLSLQREHGVQVGYDNLNCRESLQVGCECSDVLGTAVFTSRPSAATRCSAKVAACYDQCARK